MLYWPARSPESCSNRLPGGTRRSLSFPAMSSCVSWRNACLCRSGPKRGTRSRRHTFSVRLSLNDRITNPIITEAGNNGQGHHWVSCVSPKPAGQRPVLLFGRVPIMVLILGKRLGARRSSDCTGLAAPGQTDAQIRVAAFLVSRAGSATKVRFRGQCGFDDSHAFRSRPIPLSHSNRSPGVL